MALITEAAANGAELIVFPEAFVPGYSAWVWRLRPGGDWDLSEQIHQRLLENAVDLTREDLAKVRTAAAEAGVTVVIGINERDGAVGRSTLYNSAVVIGSDGKILNHHRKLMPTNPERMVWGFGDASGLRAIDTPVGRIGILLCWENYMPLARFALYAQGKESSVRRSRWAALFPLVNIPLATTPAYQALRFVTPVLLQDICRHTVANADPTGVEMS